MSKQFWEEFLRKPEEAAKHPLLQAKLWEGVPADCRGRVWTHFGLQVEQSLKPLERIKDLSRR